MIGQGSEGIGRRDAERLEMTEIAGQQRQIAGGGDGRYRDIRKAGMAARGNCCISQTPGHPGCVRVEG